MYCTRSWRRSAPAGWARCRRRATRDSDERRHQAAHVARDRFEQEARAIAALNHPHICQIYDVGPDYLVLEYVEGDPLHGPLTLDDVVRAGDQIANALEAAHRRGILHRDLKPANVLMTRSSGEPGPAHPEAAGLRCGQAADDRRDVTRTTDGAVVGTAAYMSPEQAEGQPLDVRSDIFSFGTVLMKCCGQARVRRHDDAAVLSCVRSIRPRFRSAPALDAFVQRCLRKVPGAAVPYDDRGEGGARAGGSRTSSAGGDQPSIAVLPFANMSADKENEYFGDGLAEEIINALAQIPGLKVQRADVVVRVSGKDIDCGGSRRRSAWTHVLEGSVRKAGNRIRVTAQLIKVADGFQLWSERYDREWRTSSRSRTRLRRRSRARSR